MTTPASAVPDPGTLHSDLLLRVAAGDRVALEAIYDLFERPVYGLIVGIVRDTDDAEDVMQEVFAQIWRKASTYDAKLGSAKNWILRVAHNMAINSIRSQSSRNRQQHQSLTTVENTASDEPLLNELVGLSEEIKLLNAALDNLPVEQRELIALAFLQGLSHSEIAEQTSIPLGTVKTRIRTGLLQLRTSLKYLAPDHVALKQSTRSKSL